MSAGVIELEIISPGKTLFAGQVSCVRMPGAKAPFAVFPGHAPLVSLLCKGFVTWIVAGEEQKLPIEGGFAEVKDNKVTICVE